MRVLGILGLLPLIVMLTHHAACRKAELFEKLTGVHATPEDAMYLDLRVVAPPKENTDAS